MRSYEQQVVARQNREQSVAQVNTLAASITIASPGAEPPEHAIRAVFGRVTNLQAVLGQPTAARLLAPAISAITDWQLEMVGNLGRKAILDADLSGARGAYEKYSPLLTPNVAQAVADALEVLEVVRDVRGHSTGDSRCIAVSKASVRAVQRFKQHSFLAWARSEESKLEAEALAAAEGTEAAAPAPITSVPTAPAEAQAAVDGGDAASAATPHGGVDAVLSLTRRMLSQPASAQVLEIDKVIDRWISGLAWAAKHPPMSSHDGPPNIDLHKSWMSEVNQMESAGVEQLPHFGS